MAGIPSPAAAACGDSRMALAAPGSGWLEAGRAGADEARLRAACMRRFLPAMVRDVGRLAAATRAGNLDRT
ncbi:hypothetical protein QCF19_14160, partial [Staphylococcus aureus]|nr:hypothetical protein [Staphylococcus aureus]